MSIIPTLEAKLTGETWYRMVASNDATQNVKVKADYVCDGTDDQTEIQNAVDAAFAENGGIVKLSSGNFNLSAPITLHPTVTLLGQHGEQIFNPDQSVTSSRLVITAGFVGGAAIVLLGQTAAGYANKSAEQRIYAITILGDDAPAESTASRVATTSMESCCGMSASSGLPGRNLHLHRERLSAVLLDL
ncbi:hypothetical protein [Streptomyces phage JXY1]|uniref:Pectate lyase superfamily protein domain-containing protein n=1 Tax=Streptomyces phage JXY1 TaxID=2708562 RepID=A0A6C0RS76_9CAUD|nr:minor tail protein [Streptomyces phage JXY1]QIA28799.1 hypothetical protein [Streptomyces phage JXY1]